MSGILQIAREGLAGYDGIVDRRDAMRSDLDSDLGCAGGHIRCHLAHHAAAGRSPVLVVVSGWAEEPRDEQNRETQRRDALEPARQKPSAGIAPWNTAVRQGVLCGPSHSHSV
ncbi:MAG: hypothetical protein M8835_14020 [marine benthic group bacterium]|nr:hypothetical protein [Gemmatimonadota bacterium]MCL7975659.1 hypothetical protein [Gemmatimonadota bacterium]